MRYPRRACRRGYLFLFPLRNIQPVNRPRPGHRAHVLHPVHPFADGRDQVAGQDAQQVAFPGHAVVVQREDLARAQFAEDEAAVGGIVGWFLQLVGSPRLIAVRR